VPVPHADVRGRRTIARHEPRPQPFCLPHRQLGDGRDVAVQLVVTGHFFDAAGTDATAAEDVGEEGTNVSTPLRAAEGNDENGAVV